MAKKTLQKLSPKLEEELRDKLEEMLDEHDDVADKRRRLSKLLGGHLKVIDSTVSLIRRQLKGLDLDQLEIPGTEMPVPAQDPLVQDILRIAGGIVEKQKAEEAAEEEKPEPLAWKAEGAKLVATVEGGHYDVEPGPANDGGHRAFWVPADGRGKTLGMDLEKSEAKEACRAHHVERFADQLLKSAGAGDLTRGDLKGPAEKFRKGR